MARSKKTAGSVALPHWLTPALRARVAWVAACLGVATLMLALGSFHHADWPSRAVAVHNEPTANLDFGNQVRVLEQVRRLAGAGVGVLWATHDPGHALECATRTALVAPGGLRAYGPTPEVVTAPALSALYGVAVRIETLPASGVRVCTPVSNGTRAL
jgi:ABC-type hemin transport system ATPase subunit